MMCHAGFGGVDAATRRVLRASSRRSAAATADAHGSDGPDAVQAHGQNTENAPVEETERSYPVRIDRLSLVEDSDGPGRFRGGLGLRKDYRFDRPMTFTVLADRDQGRAVGRARRRGRRAGALRPRSATASSAAHRRARSTRLAGDVVSYRTCGGGGYGPPEERDPERVAARRARGEGQPRARARRVPRRDRRLGRLDDAATAALRAEGVRSQRPIPVKTAATSGPRRTGWAACTASRPSHGLHDGMWTKPHTFETKDT